MNVHFHALGLDGVFAAGVDGTLRFHRLPPPTDADVARLVGAIARRIGGLLGRRGVTVDTDAADPLAAESVALSGLASAAVQGRLALGPRAGARVERLGHDPDAPWVESSRPLQARCDGCDLHAGVTVAGEDRYRLEQLCRYLLRPPIAQERLTKRPDGTVLVRLKTPWRDGTTHLRFEPLTLLERLAALTPRPRINVLIYHGILAPHAAGRCAAVAYGRPAAVDQPHGHEPVAAPPAKEPVPAAAASPEAAARGPVPGPPAGSPASRAPVQEPAEETPSSATDSPPSAGRPPHWRWADLLQRVFAVDVLLCPNCGGRMRVLATIDDPRVVRRILTHLGLVGDAGPPPGPPACQAA